MSDQRSLIKGNQPNNSATLKNSTVMSGIRAHDALIATEQGILIKLWIPSKRKATIPFNHTKLGVPAQCSEATSSAS